MNWKLLVFFVVLIAVLVWYVRPEPYIVALIAILVGILVASLLSLQTKKPHFEPFVNQGDVHIYALVADPDSDELEGVLSSFNAHKTDVSVLVTKDLGCVGRIAQKHKQNDTIVVVNGHNTVMMCEQDRLLEVIKNLDTGDTVLEMPGVFVGKASAWTSGRLKKTKMDKRLVSKDRTACFLYTGRAAEWACNKSRATKSIVYC